MNYRDANSRRIDILNKLNEVGKTNKVFITWVPGHSGIKRNEEANTLAKEGARMSLIGPASFCGIGKEAPVEDGIVGHWRV